MNQDDYQAGEDAATASKPGRPTAELGRLATAFVPARALPSGDLLERARTRPSASSFLLKGGLCISTVLGRDNYLDKRRGRILFEVYADAPVSDEKRRNGWK